MATENELLEKLSTEQAAISTSDLADKVQAGREGTRKQLTRLKGKRYVEGDSQEGWIITEEGKKALGLGLVRPSMIAEGVTPRQMFEEFGQLIGIRPERIALTTRIVWSGDHTDLVWVWNALGQADIDVDLKRVWVNSWRAYLHKAIPVELEKELAEPEEKKVQEKGKGEAGSGGKPVEGRSYILQDDMPVYVGKDLGDLLYQDAVDLARIRAARGARAAESIQPQQSSADDIIKIVNAVREWGGQGSQGVQKSYMVTQGEEGAIVQEVEPGKPVVLSAPQASKPAATYFVDSEGAVREAKPGEPIVVRQQTAPLPQKTFIVRQTPEGIIAEEHDLGKPIIINAAPALPGSNMPPMMPFPVMDGGGKPVLGQDGQPVYANLDPMLKYMGFQGEQRRADERHSALMGLVQTVKENLPDGIQALRDAAAEARGSSGGKTPQQPQGYECNECHAKFTLPRELAEGENVKCPTCGHEYNREEVLAT